MSIRATVHIQDASVRRRGLCGAMGSVLLLEKEGQPATCRKCLAQVGRDATDRTDVQQIDKRAVRESTLEPVRALLSVLEAAGMTTVEAAKAIRWATHRIEGQQAAATRDTGLHYDDPVFEPCPRKVQPGT